MPTVTYNNESFTCTIALKGSDYIHLLDASGHMIVAFDGVVNFSGFSITDGDWTSPTAVDLCSVAVIEDDGTIGESSFAPNDFLTKGSVTPASIGAAALDSNGKVTATQASAPITSITASTTLALAHAGKLLQANSTSAITLTIPTNDSVAFPNSTEIEIVRWNTGAVTFAAASGVTLVSLESAKTIAGRYGCASLKKIATNTWLLAGALE